MLRVVIKKKNFELTPALKTYINEKLVGSAEKLTRGIEHDSPILEIEAARITRHHKKGKIYHVEANLSLGRHLLRSGSDGEHFHEAVDLAEEDLKRAIRAFKEKFVAKLKRGARIAKKELHLDPAARWTGEPRLGRAALYRKGRIRNEGI